MFDGFDRVFDFTFDGTYPDVLEEDPYWVGLATDGAKAWTLDGWRYEWREQSQLGPVVPNLLTGSNIDIQLAEATFFPALHYKSILRVMVYAPADGIVKEGAYIWSTQVHQEWEVPVPTTVTLEKAEDYKIAGLESATVVATVKDQFGKPYPGVAVDFNFTVLEGTITADAGPAAAVTDENGMAVYTWAKALGQWGVESVTATCLAGIWPAVTSSAEVIQWIYYDDNAGTGVGGTPAFPGSLLTGTVGNQEIVVTTGMSLWSGKLLKVYLNPGGNVFQLIGQGTYYDDTVNDVHISTNTAAWAAAGIGFFVQADTNNSNNVPNWAYERTE